MNCKNSILELQQTLLTIFNFKVVVSIWIYQRINVQYAFVLHDHYVGIDVESLIFFEDIDHALIFLSIKLFVDECEVRFLKSLLAHVDHCQIADLQVVLEVHGVSILQYNLLLESVGILIFEDGLLFGRFNQVFQ
jgi:hypothetical protein